MGIVHIVGAGCGDHDLITLRGKHLLENCDTVVYDSLIDMRLLAYVPDEAEKICVGKRAGAHSETQDTINAILVQKAKEGKSVVRLKGGDPLVFGRGGEEINALAQNGIPYTIVPGISSCIAVPELAGIPVTHRNISREFHVITAHTAKGGIDFSKYAASDGTLVFLMWLGSLGEIADGLIKGGRSKDTPAAVISDGGSTNQRTVRAPLYEIEEKCAQSGITAPAVIVVGETAAFNLTARNRLTVSVCSTARFANKLTAKIGKIGADVRTVCDMRVEEIHSGEFDSAAENLQRYKWLVLTSPNGAEIFLKRMRELKIDLRRLSGIKIAVIGKGTAAVLERSGIYADIIPKEFTSEYLARAVAKAVKENERVLILRAKQGSPILEKVLDENNVKYDNIETYDVTGELREKSVNTDYMVFASASGVRAFFGNGGQIGDKTKILSIGKITAQELGVYGYESIAAEEYSINGIAKLLEKLI